MHVSSFSWVDSSALQETHLLSTAGGHPRLAVVRSRAGGAWSTPASELGTEPVYGAVWEGLGESVEYYNMHLPSDSEARAFAVAFYRWLSQGKKLQANQVRLMPGGLEKIVQDAFMLLGPGTMNERRTGDGQDHLRPVSGEKVVYRIGED